MNLKFQWDARKAAANAAKHGVTFAEALTAFADPLAHIFPDADHSITEEREIIIGHSKNNRLLIVCFTERADAVRIFSARRVTKQERNDYEENTKS